MMMRSHLADRLKTQSLFLALDDQDYLNRRSTIVALLRAMETPTDAMIAVGADRIANQYDLESFMVGPETAEEIWRNMVQKLISQVMSETSFRS